MTDQCLNVDGMDTLRAVFGNRDENARLLEKTFGVTIVCRGTEIKLTGPDDCVAAAGKAIDAMLSLLADSGPLTEQLVRYCISLAGEGDGHKVKEMSGEVVLITAKGKPVRPKTLGQSLYVNAIRQSAITFGVGPAGTGKTYLAVAMAVKALKAHEVERIVLTRPAVEAGEKLGFLPGDLQDKVDPYLRPLYDALFDMLGIETYQRLMEKQTIEIAPLAYMRGRTLDDAFIILDEAQNTSPEQMKMFLTRMGAGSKVVVTGDVTQIDLPDKSRSGLVQALRVLAEIEGIEQVRFSEKDVVRHRLVQEIIKAYEKAERLSPNDRM
ncbi:MAG: PhoH family protein [Ruthenibacterium sp.]